MHTSFSYWSLLRYFTATVVTSATVTSTVVTTVTVTAATVTITLLCYWNFVADTKSFRCGWIDNSTANTWEYSLTSPCVESTNLGWILYPRKLLRSPILVGYQRSWCGAGDKKIMSVLWWWRSRSTWWWPYHVTYELYVMLILLSTYEVISH